MKNALFVLLALAAPFVCFGAGYSDFYTPNVKSTGKHFSASFLLRGDDRKKHTFTFEVSRKNGQIVTTNFKSAKEFYEDDEVAQAAFSALEHALLARLYVDTFAENLSRLFESGGLDISGLDDDNENPIRLSIDWSALNNAAHTGGIPAKTDRSLSGDSTPPDGVSIQKMNDVLQLYGFDIHKSGDYMLTSKKGELKYEPIPAGAVADTNANWRALAEWLGTYGTGKKPAATVVTDANGYEKITFDKLCDKLWYFLFRSGNIVAVLDRAPQSGEPRNSFYYDNSVLKAGFAAPENWADDVSIERKAGGDNATFGIKGFSTAEHCGEILLPMLTDPANLDRERHEILTRYRRDENDAWTLHYLPLGSNTLTQATTFVGTDNSAATVTTNRVVFATADTSNVGIHVALTNGDVRITFDVRYK